MAKRPSLKSINRLHFLHNNDERKQKIEVAPTTPQPKEFTVNKLSRQLHPDKQFVTIGEIKVLDDNCKSFRAKSTIPKSCRTIRLTARFPLR